jgi:hypothetical protein
VSKELGLRVARALQDQAEERGMDVLPVFSLEGFRELCGRPLDYTCATRQLSGQSIRDPARDVRYACERVT